MTKMTARALADAMDRAVYRAANAAYDAAVKAERLSPSPAGKDAVKAAWRVCAAVSPRQKRGGFASRAGQRQAREREAMRQDSLRRAAARRFR